MQTLTEITALAAIVSAIAGVTAAIFGGVSYYRRYHETKPADINFNLVNERYYRCSEVDGVYAIEFEIRALNTGDINARIGRMGIEDFGLVTNAGIVELGTSSIKKSDSIVKGHEQTTIAIAPNEEVIILVKLEVERTDDMASTLEEHGMSIDPIFQPCLSFEVAEDETGRLFREEYSVPLHWFEVPERVP